MTSFTLYKIGRIKNKWITDGLSEILSTFILALFVYSSGAQSILSHGVASSAPGKALAAGVGLMLAVYCGFNASGACVNPSVALMFCLTGKLEWKRWPLYAICEFIGAFIAASVTFGAYHDLINVYDGGVRQVFGDNATVGIFTSFPRSDISRTTGFFDVFIGCGLLTGTTCFLIDPNNANTANGVIPVALSLLLYGILMGFGFQSGSPINFAIDFSGRFFAYCAGYGNQVFTKDNYWFWVPPVACLSGTIAFVSTYQLMIGNHLPMNDTSTSEQVKEASSGGNIVAGTDGIHEYTNENVSDETNSNHEKINTFSTKI